MRTGMIMIMLPTGRLFLLPKAVKRVESPAADQAAAVDPHVR
jgi:hypothetical protein